MRLNQILFSSVYWSVSGGFRKISDIDSTISWGSDATTILYFTNSLVILLAANWASTCKNQVARDVAQNGGSWIHIEIGFASAVSITDISSIDKIDVSKENFNKKNIKLIKNKFMKMKKKKKNQEKTLIKNWKKKIFTKQK